MERDYFSGGSEILEYNSSENNSGNNKYASIQDFISSPEGRSALIAALERSASDILRLQKARRISPEKLHERITI